MKKQFSVYLMSKMNKQRSLSRISSRSLSKIKTKIELAFARPSQQHKNTKQQPSQLPVRSKSTKSLPKYQIQSTENNIPFALALKTGLLSSQKKNSAYQTPAKKSRNQSQYQNAKNDHEQQVEDHKNRIVCSRALINESIKGYSWYHQKGKQLISVCKVNEGKLLRYFAVKEQNNRKKSKRVLAALEDQILFAGSKQYIVISSNHDGLIKPSEASQLSVSQSKFVLVLDRAVMAFCNVNRLIGDIFCLIADGLRDLDTIANILGRKVSDIKNERVKKNVQEKGEVFILLILIQEAIKYKRPSKNSQVKTINF